MDKTVEILLKSQQNIASVNQDSYEKIELANNPNQINEYDIRNVLSATEVFDAEREANPVYRIYGRMEYMSLLNGLKNNYIYLEDFFSPQTNDSKNIFNSFDFYLVKPAISGYTHMNSGSSTIMWVRYFEVIATPNEFELFPVGFSNNVYGEQAYSFNFKTDFDVSGYQDEFGFPATELFLYAQYKKDSVKNETLSATTWNTSGVKSKVSVNTIDLNIGDFVETQTGVKIGDVIEYAKTEFLQAEHTPQTFYIKTPYIKIVTIQILFFQPIVIPYPRHLVWKYNPFIPIRLRYFDNSLYKANSGGTSYEQVNSIPYYATEIDNNGNFVWREIMPEGYIDPITGIGTDHPFVNKKRYLFSTIVFDVVPDLDDAFTLDAFSEIWFSRYQKTLNTTPAGDINNIGKPCQ